MDTSLGAIRRLLTITALLVWILSSTAAAQVLYADVMAGSDPFAKVQNAVNALANGGQISAASFSGSLTITSGNLSISQSGIRVEWGSATFTLGNNVINIQASNVEFVCQKGGTIFQSQTNTGSGVSGQNLASVIKVAPLSGTISNVRLRGCVVQGNRTASNDDFSGANCVDADSVATGLIVEDLTLTNCGYNGLLVTNSDNWVIQRNYIAQSSGPGININSTILPSSGAYLGQKIIRDNQLYDTVTSVGACDLLNHPAWCSAGGGRGGGTVPVGNYELNVGNAAGYGATANIVIVHNVVQNGYIANGTTTNGSCNGSFWDTSNAQGCLGGIQLNAITGYEVASNVVTNTQAECIAVGYSTGRVHHNNLTLCATTSSGTITSDGSGGISYYISNTKGMVPNVPTTQGYSEIDNNIVTDAGYVFQLVLGQTTNTNSMKVTDLSVHDNVGQAVMLGTVSNATLIDGIVIRNATAFNLPCTGGVTCNWQIVNSSFANNDLQAATHPWKNYTGGDLTAASWMVAGPNGFAGPLALASPNNLTAQIKFQSVAGFALLNTDVPAAVLSCAVLDNALCTSSVDGSGNPNFLAGGTCTAGVSCPLNVSAASGNLVYFVNGTYQVLTSSASPITVTVNKPTSETEFFIFVNQDTTNPSPVSGDLVATNCPQAISYTAPSACSTVGPSQPQYWFDLSTNLMKVSTNGTSFSAQAAILLGVAAINSTPTVDAVLAVPYRENPYFVYQNFGDGTSGVYAGATPLDGEFHYQSFMLSGATTAHSTPSTTLNTPGLFIMSQTPILLVNTALLNVNKLGQQGATGANTCANVVGYGQGGAGGGSGGSSARVGCNGGNHLAFGFNAQGGGTGGGTNGAGTAGQNVTQAWAGSGIVPTAHDFAPYFNMWGAAGASGPGAAVGNGGKGGSGGGIVIVRAPSLNLAQSSTITCNGESPTAAGGTNAGGGGGGGGGTCGYIAGFAVGNVTPGTGITATHGFGGSGNGTGGAGGNGGDGVVVTTRM